MYTYPQALTALESVAREFMKVLRPHVCTPVRVVTDANSTTASVTWDAYSVNINLPVRPAASVMTQAEFEDWTAYVLHEMGHPTHTCLNTWRTACANGLSRLTNAVEDVRMEKALIKSKHVANAKAVLSRLVSRKVSEARAANWNPNSRKEIGWTICILGRVANGYAIDAADVTWIKSKIKPGSTVETVLSWALPELAACSSTADCLALAGKIAAAIATPNAPKQAQQGTSDQGTDDQGTGDQGTDDQGTDDQGEASQSPSEAPTAGEGGEQGQDSPNSAEAPSDAPSASGQGSGHGDGSTDDETPVTRERELENRELAPQGKALTGMGALRERAVLDVLRAGNLGEQPDDRRFPRSKRSWMANQLRDTAAKASRQRTLLARALRANETDEREGGRKSGRLDRGALARVAAGNANVFARRDISEGYDTDVSILLDASGSMAGNDMVKALETGLIVAQAAASVGASCTTEVFNSCGYARAGALASRRVPNVTDFSGLTNAAMGGTPLSFHMARAAIAQAKRTPGKRRVLFVITDGGCDYGPATVKSTANYLEQTYGTVLAHVSIGTPLQGSFKAEVVVPHGSSVSEVGLEHFVKVLQAL